MSKSRSKPMKPHGEPGSPRYSGPAKNAPPAAPALAAVLLVPLLTFLTVTRHGFVNWDDPGNILLNPVVMQPSWHGVWLAWSRPLNNMYAPIVQMSFMLDAILGGGAPTAFHVSNLLLHLSAVSAVFLLLRLLLAPSLPPAVAAVATLLFAVHPLQAEPVAWATGRKDVLAGALALFAMLAHLHSCRADTRARSVVLSCLGTVLFAIALLSKATVVCVPIGVLAVQVWVERRPVRASAVRLAPWLAAAVLVSLPALHAQPMPDWLAQSVPAWRRPLVASHALVFYAGKVLWPAALAPVYPVNAVQASASPWNWLSLSLVFAAATAAAVFRGRGAAAAALFVCPLIPVLGFVPFLYQQISITADRYVYLSMFGVAAGTAWLCEAGWGHARVRRIVAAAAAVVIGACCVLAHRQAGFWRDSESLWLRGVQVSPLVPEARTNLAFALRDKGETARAEEQARLAVAASRDFHMAWSLLAELQLARAGPDAALPALRECVRSIEKLGYRDRRLAEARSNLGYALTKTGRHAQAEEELRKSIAVFELGDAWDNLAAALRAQGRNAEADEAARRAAQLGVRR